MGRRAPERQRDPLETIAMVGICYALQNEIERAAAVLVNCDDAQLQRLRDACDQLKSLAAIDHHKASRT